MSEFFTTFKAISAGLAAVGVGVAVGYHKRDRIHAAQAAVPIVRNDMRPIEIMKYGFPSTTDLKMRENYVLSYDARLRNPNWVFEHLTKENIAHSKDTVDRSNFNFVEDNSINSMFRATKKDYHRSGFDRGHLAAAANHKANPRWMEETFMMSNICPQHPTLNQITWNNLERYTRSLVNHYEDVYVCSGPLYLPHRRLDGKLQVSYEVLEPNHVAVPTHFFKVIVCHNKGYFDVQCYVMPNVDIKEPEQPITNFFYDLNAVERASGLCILSKLPKDKIKSINKMNCVNNKPKRL